MASRLFFAALLLWLSLSPKLFASGVVRGTISDEETGQPLRGTTIRVESRPWGAISDKSGTFTLSTMPAGSYTLLFSMVGYNGQKLVVDVRDGDTAAVEIRLAPQSLQTGEIVVTAGKRVQAVQDVPMSISLVDQRSIEQRNITRLDDALRYVPGVSMAREQINIRGSSGFALGLGSRTLLLLDGFPLLSGDNGDAKFDAFPMFNIEQVEVVKGAGSALYGTGALGGVVNVITATPETEPELRIRAFAGVYTPTQYDKWDFSSSPPFNGGLQAGYSQKIDNVGFLLSGGIIRDEGHLEFYDSFRWNLLGKATYELSSGTSLAFLGSATSEKRANWVYWKSLEYATYPPDNTNYAEYITSTKYNGSLMFSHTFSESLFMLLRTGLFRTHFENSASTAGNDSLASTAYASNSELQLTSLISKQTILTFGLNAQYNFLTESYLGKHNQVILSTYLQAEYRPLPELTFTAGGRIDREKTSDLDGADPEISPKLGLSYRLQKNTGLRASAGRGFRAPTIGERYAALRFSGITVERNPNLQPERGWSLEVGGDHSFTLAGEQWKVDIAAFHNEFTNMIEPQPQFETAKIRFTNITHARIQGVETSISGWLPGKIAGVEASFTAMMPTNVDSGSVLKYRSKFLAGGRVLVPIGAFQLQADYRFQSRYEEVDELLKVLQIPDAEARVPIHVLDLRLIADLYSLAGVPAMATLNVKNALNYYYTEIIANLAPTRSVILQIDTRL